MIHKIKIGTRGSALALRQTDLFVAALQAAHPEFKTPGAIEIVTITTSGDKTQKDNMSLAQCGGDKGLFAKEIEDALRDNAIDVAVHSLKDIPGTLPDDMSIPCVLKREDPRDALVSHKATRIQDLPEGAVVGTSSPRRAAIVLALRPDVDVVTFRGNVDTRLKKLAAGEVDATFLAMAGLNRLGRQDDVITALEPDVMLPAIAQGVIGIEIMKQNNDIAALLAPVTCQVTALCVGAERAYLAAMDGDCRTPLAALMQPPDPEGRARLDVMAAAPDGRHLTALSYVMDVPHLGEAERLGVHAAQEMRAKCPAFSS